MKQYHIKDVFLYCLRDYQGNNRVVAAPDGTVEQQNDYYAYGGPWGNTSTYQGLQPFKYNGKELDRVHGLDWYDYGARRYDPAFAQFTQMDPLSEKYPHLSPYAYCAGNPVRYVDPDGQRIWIVDGDKRLIYQDCEIINGQDVLEDEKLSSYVSNVVVALGELGKSQTGRALILELQNSNNDFFIQNGEENGFKHSRLITAIANNPEIVQNNNDLIDTSGSGGTITWNPSINYGGMQSNHSSMRSPFIGLGHELFHARDANKGILYPNENIVDELSGIKYKSRYKGLFKSEWRAVFGENMIRRELGLPLRIYYEPTPPYGPRLVTKKGLLFNYPR